MADGHDAWYRRELDRGRRFHGAFAGGFSAGYHNTVGSAEGWQPASFRSSRTKRQRVAGPPAPAGADPWRADAVQRLAGTIKTIEEARSFMNVGKKQFGRGVAQHSQNGTRMV